MLGLSSIPNIITHVNYTGYFSNGSQVSQSNTSYVCYIFKDADYEVAVAAVCGCNVESVFGLVPW